VEMKKYLTNKRLKANLGDLLAVEDELIKMDLGESKAEEILNDVIDDLYQGLFGKRRTDTEYYYE